MPAIVYISLTPCDFVVIVLSLVHFGVPALYYLCLRLFWLGRPWGLRRDYTYTPRVSVMVPTYNEAHLIEKKLDDLYMQDYPRESLEIVVVDSASTDGTPDIVRDWSHIHGDVTIKLVTESERRGKSCALNLGLRHATGEIVIITDADSLWRDPSTLRKVVSYFGDPNVGAVSCIKVPAGELCDIERCYRQYYNVIRVGESKIHSTPIFHGELAAFRRFLLEKIGGFPTDVGADDSHTATKIALLGYRSIIPEDVVVSELIPKYGYVHWRVRRAQHLVQHFLKTLRYVKYAPKKFREILLVEAYFHLVNPWLLLTALLLDVYLAALQSVIGLILLVLYLLAHLNKTFRTWTLSQYYLIIAALRNLLNPELVWEKQVK